MRDFINRTTAKLWDSALALLGIFFACFAGVMVLIAVGVLVSSCWEWMKTGVYPSYPAFDYIKIEPTGLIGIDNALGWLLGQSIGLWLFFAGIFTASTVLTMADRREAKADLARMLANSETAD